MAKTERLVQSVTRLPGQLPTPEVVVVAPANDSVASSNASLPRGLESLHKGGAPPPFEINVQRATPTHSMDDESCLEEDTELQLSVNTTKHHHQNKSRPLSVASTASRTNSSLTLLALPDNMRSLIKNLADRARGKKSDAATDPGLTPATSVSDLRPINTGLLKRRLDSFARRPESETDSEGEDNEKTKNSFRLCRSCPRAQSHITKLTNHLKSFRCTCDYYVDPYGNVYFYWIAVVAIAFVYNALGIFLRSAFDCHDRQRNLLPLFLTLDYVCDVIYLVDIIAVQFHLSYSDRGLLVKDSRQLSRRYFFSKIFVADALSLLPLDLLYFVRVLRLNSLLRLPRILKAHIFLKFLERYESRTKRPHVFRLVKISTYFLYLIHLNTCLYYAISKWEGFNSNLWVYDGHGDNLLSRYVHCFYWATLTLSVINDNLPSPTNTLEFAFTGVNYLFGVFVVAIIIGEIRGIVEAHGCQKDEFRRKWDHIKRYMKENKIPKEIQKRVHMFYDYANSRRLALDENRILDSLPIKMKGDLAIHVHLDTICKVALFQDCEKMLLRELVLKLKPVLFVPGDCICKKGEIGKDMFIVNQGEVTVIGDDGEILAELKAGSVFGEISLLAVGGGNRRTATVISKGFSNLFVLSKQDLHRTLVDYPDAEETMKRKAKRLLNKDIRREKRKSLNNLTASQIQLGKDVKGNRAAMAAVAAFSSSKKHNDKPSSSSSTLAAAKARVSRWKRNKVFPSNDLKADGGSRPSLNRSVSKDTQKSVVNSHVTLNSLATSCISGTTSFSEMGSDITGPSSIVSQQQQSKWPSTRDVLSSNSLYPEDATSTFSDIDSGITNDDCSLYNS